MEDVQDGSPVITGFVTEQSLHRHAPAIPKPLWRIIYLRLLVYTDTTQIERAAL